MSPLISHRADLLDKLQHRHNFTLVIGVDMDDQDSKFNEEHNGIAYYYTTPVVFGPLSNGPQEIIDSINEELENICKAIYIGKEPVDGSGQYEYAPEQEVRKEFAWAMQGKTTKSGKSISDIFTKLGLILKTHRISETYITFELEKP